MPLSALAAAVLTVSPFGFGGGVVGARRIAVERHGWPEEHEFLDIVSLTHTVPAGSEYHCIAVCIGMKLRGAAGALAGFS